MAAGLFRRRAAAAGARAELRAAEDELAMDQSELSHDAPTSISSAMDQSELSHDAPTSVSSQSAAGDDELPPKVAGLDADANTTRNAPEQRG